MVELLVVLSLFIFILAIFGFLFSSDSATSYASSENSSNDITDTTRVSGGSTGYHSIAFDSTARQNLTFEKYELFRADEAVVNAMLKKSHRLAPMFPEVYDIKFYLAPSSKDSYGTAILPPDKNLSKKYIQTLAFRTLPPDTYNLGRDDIFGYLHYLSDETVGKGQIVVWFHKTCHTIFFSKREESYDIDKIYMNSTTGKKNLVYSRTQKT